MENIIKRLLMSLWAICKFILFAIVLLPAFPYWILTGNSLIDITMDTWDKISPI